MRVSVRLVVFDLDGTLIDSYSAIHESLVGAMSRLGFEPWDLETTKRHVGWGLESLMADAVGQANVNDGVRLFRDIYPGVFLDHTTLIPKVMPALSALRSDNRKMAVATNKPSDFSRDILRHLGILEFFCQVLGPNDVSKPKPDPEMIRTILDRTGTDPDHTLYVGDMPLDIESGENAGIATALVATGTYDIRELSGRRVPVFADLGRLADWIIRGGASRLKPQGGIHEFQKTQ